MLSSRDYRRRTATHRVVTIHWSNMGKVNQRKRKWGGKINSWGMRRIDDALYIIPNDVQITTIHEALMEVLAPSDRAAFMYPYGSLKSDASAMHVRLYGKAAR